jgi:septum formation protein
METGALLRKFPYRIILGSASPRRKELLGGLGLSFEVRPVHADESWPPELTGKDIALYLARHKAASYPDRLADDQLLITADTIVWCEGRIFNKPADFEEGRQMLKSLSGRMHEVFTAVCIKTSDTEEVFCEASTVYFRTLRDDEIDYYLTEYKPYDKAGGYGVQDWIGYVAIERIEGSFYNVMGLPVRLLYERLAEKASRKTQ